MEAGEQEACAGGGNDRESSYELSKQLIRASVDGDLNKVKYLVEVGHVDPHSCRDEKHHNTPLYWAVAYGHLDIVRYLVEERNCDVRSRNRNGNTPLHRAAYEKRLDIMQYLISERGCDPMCRGEYGRTPLHMACQRGPLDIVKYLIEDLKVDSSCQDDDTGVTPLHLAAEFGKLEVVQYLIEERQCDAECRDRSERTPLCCAAIGGRSEIVQYLISERHCDRMCREKHGATPLHAAAQHGRLPVVKLLVEDYMCDPGVTNKNGETPEDVAMKKCHTDIISYLLSIKNIVSTDLRRNLVDQLKPYTRKAIPTGKVLGSGAHGSVIELTLARKTVAGKVLLMSHSVNLQEVANRVCREVITIVQLHHPNIVQYKGVSFLIDQPLPVLLMERLMSNLHDYLLHPDNSNVSVERKVSILHDIASGLDYLHSQTPSIIHRDLTAKNVLLDSQLRAKISDFGNSRIMDLDPEATPETLTSLPGTAEYMPPEAQKGCRVYDPSLDVFSFGHLSLFTVTQTPIQPLLPPNFSNSSGKLCARSEVNRRARFVEEAEKVLTENHCLVAVIKYCLHNIPAQRPRTGELVTRLEKMVTAGKLADLLDNPVNHKDIATMAKYLNKWEELSPELGLTPQHETEIRKTFRDYDDQKREALQKWREIKGHAATYRTFIAAATAVSNMELVDNVKAMIGIQVQPTVHTRKDERRHEAEKQVLPQERTERGYSNERSETEKQPQL